MAFYYEPDDFLGKRLADELKLETYRTRCPDTVWENICKERKKERQESKGAVRPAIKLFPAFESGK
jgi:hypothetical protein